ncbi:MAG: phosphoribosylamine--glycine ligase [Rhodobacteraceae bacterium]|nr:phosphoribosylamine--glycine ligase [Paracoccaceae bacterium]
MNILILGGGGREHALAWKIAQSPACDRLIAAPGNPGIAAFARVEALAIENGAAVASFCRHENIDFVVIGPEAPLAAGVADALIAADIACFGPRQAAAQLESSKTFTKEICAACKAPTAAWTTFERPDAAKIHIMASGAPIVVKADGLAAGKGVTVAATVGQALKAIDDIFADAANKGQGARVLIEEAMSGVEASLFVLTNGEQILPLGSAQDHKRAYDGDKGPNTGGMGAFSPTPALPPELEQQAIDEIVRPTLREMAKRGTPYRGVLYAGLMVGTDRDGAPKPRLVEYNARFGDPEAQVLVRRLESDLLPALMACSEPVGVLRRQPPTPLRDIRPVWRDQAAVVVTMAAKGYPGPVAAGEAISGLSEAGGVTGVEIFHAGTAQEDDKVVSRGGRVLSVTALGDTLAQARERAYAAIELVNWRGTEFRRDIGAAAVAQETAALAAAQAEKEAADRLAAQVAATQTAGKERETTKAHDAQPDAASNATGPKPEPSQTEAARQEAMRAEEQRSLIARREQLRQAAGLAPSPSPSPSPPQSPPTDPAPVKDSSKSLKLKGGATPKDTSGS